MGKMMFSEIDIAIIIQLPADQLRDEQFLLQPDRHRHLKRPERLGESRQISGQQPLEFQKRFIIEADTVQLLCGDARFFQTVLNGTFGEIRIMLLTREALLLGGSHQLTILKQRCRCIMIKTGDS